MNPNDERILTQIINHKFSNLTLNEIIELISNNPVISYSPIKHQDILDHLEEGVKNTFQILDKMNITSDRINEVGNKIDEYIISGFNMVQGLTASKSVTPQGKKKKGYPNIIIHDKNSVLDIYISSKTTTKKKTSSLRSLYISAGSDSSEFKVPTSGLHFIVLFEFEEDDNIFKPKNGKIINLDNLSLKIKVEFSSSTSKYNIPTRIIRKI